MGEACSTYVETGQVHNGFWWEQLRGKRPLGRPRHRWIILNWIFKKWDVEVWGWIDLGQQRDWWQALVNAVMNFRVAKYAGNLLTI
jgi:hypothetical protein